jgi:low affinity Fe/Cu permease
MIIMLRDVRNYFNHLLMSETYRAWPSPNLLPTEEDRAWFTIQKEIDEILDSIDESTLNEVGILKARVKELEETVDEASMVLDKHSC